MIQKESQTLIIGRLCTAVHDDLLNGHVGPAHATLDYLVQQCRDGKVRADFEELQSNYKAMLAFLASGGSDDNRFCNFKEMKRDTWVMLQRVRRALRLLDKEDLYSKTARFWQERGVTDQMMADKWIASMPSVDRFDVQDELFDYLWTSPMWSKRQTIWWYDFLARQDKMVQTHLSGAVFLSALEYPDMQKVALLSMMQESGSEEAACFSSVALVLLSQCYGGDMECLADYRLDVSRFKQNRSVMDIQREQALIFASVKSQEREDQELEAIGREKSSDQIKQVVRVKMRYIRQRLERGYDPNLNRLSLLHSCDFLRTCSHWFLPFDFSHPIAQEVVASASGTENDILLKMTQLSPDCDVDKFALCDLISRNPALAKGLAKHIEVKDVDRDELAMYTKPVARVVQNLYRFFCSSPISQGFPDLFRSPELLVRQPLWIGQADCNVVMQCVYILMDAEYYDVAGGILDCLLQFNADDREMLKKRGVCHEHAKEWAKALGCYTKITYLEEPDSWLAQHLCECCLSLKRHKEAGKWLEVWRQFEPNNNEVLSKCLEHYISEKKYDDALKILYQQDYVAPGNPGTMCKLLRCQLLCGKLDSARKYCEKLFSSESAGNSVVWEAHLYCGHIKFITGDWKAASSYYVLAAAEYKRQTNASDVDFMSRMESDAELMIANGVDEQDINMMCDAVRMQM